MRLLLQKQSDLGLRCLSRHFWLVTCVQNFRTFTVKYYIPGKVMVKYPEIIFPGMILYYQVCNK